MPEDILDSMIRKVRKRRKPNIPMFITAGEVFHDFLDDMTDIDLKAMAAVRVKAIEDEGVPCIVGEDGELHDLFPPKITERLHRIEDPAEIDSCTQEEVLCLATVGFFAYTAEKLMMADGGN